MKIIRTLIVAAIFMPTLSIAQTIDPIVSHIDKSVRPQDDFFEYANGAWFHANPIPASEKDNGIFTIIQDTIDNQVRRICQEAAAHQQDEGSTRQKIGDYYASYMDSVGRNNRGLSELQRDLYRLRSIDNLSQLIRMLVYTMRVSGEAMFRFGIWQDQKNSDQYAFYLMQGGLSLPDRRYMLKMMRQQRLFDNAL